MTSHRHYSAVSVLISCLTMAALPVAAQEEAGFELNIVLSGKATNKLASGKETIIVDASYSGDPKPGAEKHANEAGQIDIGNERLETAGKSGHVSVAGAKIDKKRLDWIAGPMMVNVNLYTGRKSSAENLIDCDFVDGPLANVRKAPITLRCALITEHSNTVMKP